MVGAAASQLLTHREPGATWSDRHRTWQLDCRLIPHSLVTATYSRTTTGMESDHAPLIIELQCQFAHHPPPREQTTKHDWSRIPPVAAHFFNTTTHQQRQMGKPIEAALTVAMQRALPPLHTAPRKPMGSRGHMGSYPTKANNPLAKQPGPSSRIKQTYKEIHPH